MIYIIPLSVKIILKYQFMISFYNKIRLFCVVGVFIPLSISAQQPASQDKVAKSILTALSGSDNNLIPIHIVLTTQLDYADFERKHLDKRTSLQQKSGFLMNDLKEIALNSQLSLTNYLKQNKGVSVSSIKSHWIANALSCEASEEAIKEIALREDVAWIGLNARLKPTSDADDSGLINSEMIMPAPDGIEKGLAAINAPKMWELGYTGYNRIAFIADTGVDPTHPSIGDRYNGRFYSKQQSWYSFSGNKEAYDCDRHGTHVAGTILGLDRLNNDTIGVAFNARWIGADILCGIGTPDNIGAFEWALNPDGDPNTSDDIPDVINNSWYDPSLDGLDCYSIYVPVLQALETAGVAVVFSAGNAGPGPETITQPHNININEVNAFTVGALNGNASILPIASFSSQGPSHCPGEGPIKIKPEVSAPGVNVRSCIPGNDYALLSGTSMAAPHVAGAILLLKEAFPYLGGKDLKLALYRTCRDLGDPGEDNKFGMGIIDVFAAYNYLVDAGNIPAPGRVQQDVILLEVKHAVNGCDNQMRPLLHFENAGSDTLTTLDIRFKGNDFEYVQPWQGILLPNERVLLNILIEEMPSENGEVIVTLENPNGKSDERQLNNQKSFNVNITSMPMPVEAYSLKEFYCRNSQIILKTPVSDGEPYTTNWYDVPFGGQEIYEGNVIHVTNQLDDFVLYAEPAFKAVTGKPVLTSTPGAGFYDDQLEEGLVFDVNGFITLDSMTVYSQQTGIRNFYLLNERGDSITSSKKYFNKPGASQFKLGWKIPPGKNYRIIKKEGKALYADTSLVEFPYLTNQNIITIKGGTNGSKYNYFYNWKFSYSEPCGRIPYHISVSQTDVQGKAEFSFSADTLLLPESNVLTVTDKSEAAVKYFWDMGDGVKYNDASVVHAYQRPGKFDIRLEVIDSVSCLSSKSRPLVVLQTSSNKDIRTGNEVAFSVYPNPSSGSIYIICENKVGETFRYTINDLHGGTVKKGVLNFQEDQTELPIESLPPGMYILNLFSPKNQFTEKVVRL
jgi:subtilisin family serine protease